MKKFLCLVIAFVIVSSILEASAANFPFDNSISELEIELISNNTISPLKAATVEYKKREGGTYLFCNNPEDLQSEDVGAALLRENNMSGDYFFTFEHNNSSGSNLYLGFQILNTSSSPIEVTVYNIGYQIKGNKYSGDRYGQIEWSDFYNISFETQSNYSNFGFEQSYTPRTFLETTFIVPAGQYIYVFGGTSVDAYGLSYKAIRAA